MPRQNDPYSSGQIPVPQRRASMQRGNGPEPRPSRVALAQTSERASGPGARRELSVNDLLWYGSCVLLGLACLITLGSWLWRLMSGLVDGMKFAMLVVFLLIYALCLAGGWLWGKYQQVPLQEALEEQVEDLQQQIEQVTREKHQLQQMLRQQKSAAPPLSADPNQAGSTIKRSSAPGQPRSSAPRENVAPAASIYAHQVEPADQSDLQLHPHEKRFPMPDEQNMLDAHWRLIGASRRGYGHGYEGKYREDDFQIKILNDPAVGPPLALVAIADGLSSKDLSRKGALASVQGATEISEQQVAQLKALLHRNSSSEAVNAAAGNILLASLRSASNAVGRLARDLHVSTDTLHATLLVFLAVPLQMDQLFLASVQIGDGAIFAVRASSNGSEPPLVRWKQLLAPQIQGAGNEVQPFMRSQEKDWPQFLQFSVLSGIAGVMAMTDGIADDIEPPPPTPGEPDPDPFSMVDRFHRDYVVPTLKSPRPADELVRFIGYRRSQSLDDRTLIYLYQK